MNARTLRSPPPSTVGLMDSDVYIRMLCEMTVTECLFVAFALLILRNVWLAAHISPHPIIRNHQAQTYMRPFPFGLSELGAHP